MLVGGSRQDWPGPLPRLSLWPRRQRSSPSDASAEFASPDDRSPSPLEYLRRSTEATPLGDTTVLQPQLRGSRVADGLAGALALVLEPAVRPAHGVPATVHQRHRPRRRVSSSSWCLQVFSGAGTANSRSPRTHTPSALCHRPLTLREASTSPAARPRLLFLC